MSVLIKGMKMPKNCCYCALGIYEYPCNFTNQEHLWEDGRPPDCPLIEVPTPHGRLIDADSLKKKWLEAESRIGEIKY